MKTTCFVRRLLPIATALLTLAVLPARAADLPPLVATLEINGLGALRHDAGLLADALKVGPFGVMLIDRTLDAALGGSGYEGIDTNGNLRVLLFDPTAAPGSGSHAFLVPLTDDGTALLKALGAQWERDEPTGGVAHFRSSLPGADASDFFVAVHQRVGVVGGDGDLVGDILQAITAGTLDPHRNLETPGTVALDLNVPTVSTLLRRTMSAAAEYLPPPGASTNGIDTGTVLRTEADLFGNLLDQIDHLTYGLSVEPATITVHSRLEARPDSLLGRMAAASDKPADRFWNLLPEGWTFEQVGHIGQVDEVIDLYMRLIEQLNAAAGTTDDTLTALMKGAAGDIKGLLTGDYAVAFGLGNPAGLRGVTYYGVTDAKRVQAVMDRYTDVLSHTNMVARGMQGSILRDPDRQYKGVTISRFRYAMSIDPAMLSEMGPGGAPLMGIMSNLVYESAFADNIGITTIGGETLMNEAVDRLKSPGASIKAFKAVTTLFPNTPELAGATEVSAVSLADYFGFVTSLAGMPGQPPAPATRGSGVAGFASHDGTRLIGTARIGLDEISAIMGIMQPLFARGAQGMGAGAPADGDVPSFNTTPGSSDYWSCTMHPQVRQPAPGQCTLCGMDLVPGDIRP